MDCDRPANRLVAGFIGSPSMSFAPVEALDGLRLPALAGLTVGVRPERVEIMLILMMVGIVLFMSLATLVPLLQLTSAIPETGGIRR